MDNFANEKLRRIENALDDLLRETKAARETLEAVLYLLCSHEPAKHCNPPPGMSNEETEKWIDDLNEKDSENALRRVHGIRRIVRRP